MKDEGGIAINVLLFVFFCCVYYLVRCDGGEYYINKGITEIFIFSFLALSSQMVLWISRYYMPKVVVNGHNGSILGKPIIIKGSGSKNNESDPIVENWAIFNTGESLEPFHLRGKLSVLVIPFDTLKTAGSNYISRVFVRRTPVMSLPSEVYSFLVHNSIDYNLENVYFGKFSEDFVDQNPDIMDYEAYIGKMNHQLNLRNDMLEGRNDMLIEMKKFAEEMSGDKKRWYDVLRRSKRADDDEER